MRAWSVDRHRRPINEFQVSSDHYEFEGPAIDIGSECIDPTDTRPNVYLPSNNLNDFDVFKSSKSSSVWIGSNQRYMELVLTSELTYSNTCTSNRLIDRRKTENIARCILDSYKSKMQVLMGGNKGKLKQISAMRGCLL
jgi:hypothetical protein